MDGRFRSDLVALVPRMRRFAYALTGSTDLGDDLVQAACERALRSAEKFEPGTRMDSWMFRIIQNLWLDDRRRHRRRGSTVEPDATMLSDEGVEARRLDDRVALAQVRAAVDELPEDQRSVLVLVAIEGMNYREASEVLGIPLGTVMSRLSRARERLLSILELAAQPDHRTWAR